MMLFRSSGINHNTFSKVIRSCLSGKCLSKAQKKKKFLKFLEKLLQGKMFQDFSPVVKSCVWYLWKVTVDWKQPNKSSFITKKVHVIFRNYLLLLGRKVLVKILNTFTVQLMNCFTVSLFQLVRHSRNFLWQKSLLYFISELLTSFFVSDPIVFLFLAILRQKPIGIIRRKCRKNLLNNFGQHQINCNFSSFQDDPVYVTVYPQKFPKTISSLVSVSKLLRQHLS